MKTLMVLALCAVASLAAACGSDDSGSGDGEVIRVGLITDQSGRFVSFGNDITVASELAVEEVNSSGGVNGAELELEVADTAAEPSQAVSAYRELADKDVVAVSGPLSSPEAEVAFEQAASLQVPIITGTANTEGITEPGDDWALRNTATNTEFYSVAMPAWADEYDIGSAVLVFDEEEPVSAAAAELAIPSVAEELGIEIVNADSPITFTSGQTDFSTQVGRIRDTEADGLIVMSAPTEAGLLARELQRQGDDRPVLGHPSQNSSSFYEGAADAADDWVFPSIFDPERNSEATQAYVEAMAKADEEPPTVPEAANYYDNILLIAEALRAAGTDADTPVDEARADVKQELLEITGFEGVAGKVSFGGSPDAEKTVYVQVVRNGKPQPLASR